MKKLAAAVMMLNLSAALAADMTADEWDRCSRQVKATTPQASQGADGGGLIRRTLKICGKRPAMDAQTCFALYFQTLEECRDIGGNLDELSNASRSWTLMAKLDMNTLKAMCKDAHRTKRLPDADEFEAAICNLNDR